MTHNLYSKSSSSRLHVYSNEHHLTPIPYIVVNRSDQTYISSKPRIDSINKVEQNNTKKVSLPISLDERTELETKEPSRTIIKVDEIDNQYINKQLNKRKQRNDLEKRDNNIFQISFQNIKHRNQQYSAN